jgi:hypothetical protein
MNRINKSALAMLGMTSALMLGGVAQAHHSKSMFDSSKCATIEGTVRTFEWAYPHSWLWVIVHDAATGKDDIWGFESMSPAQLYGVDHRWTRDVLKKGDKIKVRYSPTVDGSLAGSMNSVTLPDGRVFLGAPDACSGAVGNPKSPGDFDSPFRK